MAGARHPSILHYLRQVIGAPAAATVGDAELLRRFVDQGDEAAFELLLWRHAALVLHVCRQVLGDEQSAEDAFQATFLVLARKASSLGRREALGSWLYRVAHRISLKALAKIRKRRIVERELNGHDSSAPADNTEDREQRRIVAEEVHRLPAKFRAAIVACYFEAKSLEEAADQLGWPRGTVASRLSRGRELLRRRLLRRGIAPATAALGTALAASSSPAALTGLIRNTVLNVKRFAASSAAGTGVPPSIAVLVEGALQAMYWTRVKMVMVVLLLVGLGGAGTTFWAAAPKPAEPSSPSAPPTAANRGRDKEQPDDTAKLAREMVRSRLNLKKLALAMSEHAATNQGALPPPALISKDGKAVLSWRVLLLPYLGERELYEQFRLSEPWDGPNNKKLLSKMPSVYAPPGVKTPQPFSTFYQVFVSPKPKDGNKATEKGGKEVQAAFVSGQPQHFGHFVDGLPNTIFIVEAGKAVPWTQPEDLPYAADKALPELGGLFPGIFHAAFANGDVRRMTKNYDQHYLRTVITSNGGEVMDFQKIESRSAAVEWQRKNGELRRELEDARGRLHLLQEEQGALKERSGKVKGLQDAESRLDELKQENARLQKELETIRGEIRSLDDAIQIQILQYLQNPPKIITPKKSP